MFLSPLKECAERWPCPHVPMRREPFFTKLSVDFPCMCQISPHIRFVVSDPDSQGGPGQDDPYSEQREDENEPPDALRCRIWHAA